jgi:hypothetical protein
MTTLDERKLWLEALRKARANSVKEVTYQGNRISRHIVYRSDRKLLAAIAAAEGEIATLRPRVPLGARLQARLHATSLSERAPLDRGSRRRSACARAHVATSDRYQASLEGFRNGRRYELAGPIDFASARAHRRWKVAMRGVVEWTNEGVEARVKREIAEALAAAKRGRKRRFKQADVTRAFKAAQGGRRG